MGLTMTNHPLGIGIRIVGKRAACGVLAVVLGVVALAGAAGCLKEETQEQPLPSVTRENGAARPAPVEEQVEQVEQTQRAEPQVAEQPAESPQEEVEQDSDPYAVLLASIAIAPESDGGVDYERDDYTRGGWAETERPECSVSRASADCGSGLNLAGGLPLPSGGRGVAVVV